MNTVFLLLAQYSGRTIIPLEDVRRDYFAHLTIENFRRKLASGAIQLVVTSLETSQKAERGVHLTDLATYIDSQRQKALTEFNKLHG